MKLELDGESEYFFKKLPWKTYVGGQFFDRQGNKLRYVSKVIDGREGLMFTNVKGETTIKRTPGGRFEIRATVFEDDRGISQLTLQKYNADSDAANPASDRRAGLKFRRLWHKPILAGRSG